MQEKGDLIKKIALFLKEKRIEQGLSSHKLSYRTETISRVTINRIERTLVDPKISTLKELTDALDIKLKDLFKAINE